MNKIKNDAAVNGKKDRAIELFEQGKKFLYAGNETGAIRCFRKAADMGSGEAANELCKCSAGKKDNKYQKLAFKYQLELALTKPYDPGIFIEVGKRYYYGKGVKRDYKKAFYWLTRCGDCDTCADRNDCTRSDLCDNHGPYDQYRILAQMYEHGYGVAKDWSKAADQLEKLEPDAEIESSGESSDELPQMFIAIARLHMTGGHGLLISYERAFDRLSSAEFLGNKYARGLIQQVIRMAVKEKKKIIQLFNYIDQDYADRSEIDAYYLGVLYENGWGTKRNIKKAMELYAEAAKNDDEDAKRRLQKLQGKCQNG